MSIYLNACERCQGAISTTSDRYGPTASCLSCGHEAAYDRIVDPPEPDRGALLAHVQPVVTKKWLPTAYGSGKSKRERG